jgi:hypothetical protein
VPVERAFGHIVTDRIDKTKRSNGRLLGLVSLGKVGNRSDRESDHVEVADKSEP